MFPLDRMLDVELLIRDRRRYRSANIFGFIAFSDPNPFIIKVLKDKDFWQSINDRTEGWILYAIKPDSDYYNGGNADFINSSLGLEPNDYPQLVILSIGTDQVMMQKSYPIFDASVDEAYNSIKHIIDIVTDTAKSIYPEYRSSTNVHREVLKAVDAELASGRWKRTASSFAKFVLSLFID